MISKLFPNCLSSVYFDLTKRLHDYNDLTLSQAISPMRFNSSMQGLYSLSGKTSYRKISWSLEAARFGFKLFQSLWNLAGTSAALLPRCLSNFRAIRPLEHPISRLRDLTRFGGKTSYRLVNRGPEWVVYPSVNKVVIGLDNGVLAVRYQPII